MPNIVDKTIDKLRSGSKDLALSQFANQLKRNQKKCVAQGNPITEDEIIRDLTSDWVGVTKTTYERMGITLDELIEAGKEAIKDTSDVLPEPTGMAKKLINLTQKIGRNAKCPCGSGLKFKKCCGRNG